MLISKEEDLLNYIFLSLVTLALQFFLLLDMGFVKFVNINIDIVIYSLVKKPLNLVKERKNQI